MSWITRDSRIMGMAILFMLLTSFAVGSWRYGGRAMVMAAILGAFAGEAWHRWRVTSCKNHQVSK